MSNDRAFASLDAMISRVRSIPELATRAAPDAAHAVDSSLRSQIDAGRDPSGKTWAPKKDGGGKPLTTAGKALAVVAIGPKVFARLTGHIARHHKGIARGGVERQILPSGGLPPSMSAAIREVLTDHFRRITEGG